MDIHLTLILILILITLTASLPVTRSQFRTFRLAIPTNAKTEAKAITTDRHGNTFIVGDTDGNFGPADTPHLNAVSIFIAKFSRSGILVWLTRTGSAHNDKATGIYHFGRMVYVTGVTQGKLSKQAPVGHKSDGDTDGFVLAYNAFSGKRAWSTQLGASGYATEVNCVVVSRFGGVVVAGNSDASLFEKVRKKGNELFVARLNHAVGTVLRASQHAFMSDAVQTIPKQLLFSSDDAMIYVNLQLRHKNGHSKSMVTALSTSNFKVSPSMSRDVESVAGIGDVPMRLGVDRETGSMAVSYSTMRKGSEKHSFAVSILPRTRDRKATSASVHFTARSDDLATGIIINSAGYALMLGSSNQGETTHDAVPALWIYDVRTRATVRQYRGLEGVHEICNKISDFNVDSNGDIVFAGVRMREKEQHVLIGTFGIRDLEKYRTREEIMKPQAVIVEGNSTYVADEPGALVGQPSRKKSFWKRLDGKFSTGGISVIVVGSAFLILVLAVFVYCLRRKR